MIEWKQFHNAPISGSSVRIHRRSRAYQALHSFPRSGLPLRQDFDELSRVAQGTMPSADFCLCPALTSGIASAGYALTVSVSRNGAIGFAVRCCLIRVSREGLISADSRRIRLGLVCRVGHPDFLTAILLHVAQISPDISIHITGGYHEDNTGDPG